MDLPLGDLLLGLSCAALIGAAGGIVYGGILGPADKSTGRRERRSAKWMPWRLPVVKPGWPRRKSAANAPTPSKGSLKFWAVRRAKADDASPAPSEDQPAAGAKTADEAPDSGGPAT
jgi:hypothetical protein